MNKEKYIGESALNDKPSKKINLMIRNGSITTPKLADGSVTTEKLADGAVSKDKLDPTIHQEITDSVTASNEATEKAKEATVKADQATAAATAAKEAADTATQLATTATTASVQATEQAKAATTKAEEATVKANEAAQKADDSREQTEQTLGTMQEVVDKVAIKDEEGALVETPFRYIQNEEFIFAKVDTNDKLLFGIQWDATPVFGKTSAVEDRLQSQVNLLAEKVATIMGDEDTTHVIDTMNELKKFFAEIENTETLTGILANLDNIAKNLDKTTIKDEEGNVQDTPFRVIENEEFIMAVVDSEDRYLFGFYRATGKPYYPLNEMYHVEQNEEFFALWQDAANHVLLGIRRDGEIIGEIHAVNALKQVISQLQADVAALQEKVGTIDTNLKELLDVFSLQENPEYMAVKTDAEGKILASTNADGSHYIHNVKSETIPEEFSHIEDPDGRTEVTTDSEGKVMSWRDSGGKKHENDMDIANLDVSNLNLKGNSVNNIKDALKANGFNVKAPIDWSESSFIQIPEPRFAIINITNIDSMPTTKTQNKKAFLEFWDMQGNYFKKHAILNAQGNSSLGFVKKNVAIDLCDDEWVGDDTPKVRIGEWVPQDSFHMKAYYTDFFRGVGAVSYKLYDQIVRTRGNMYDRPWKKALLDMSKIGTTTKSLGNPYVGDYSLLTDTGARCFPDGFPVAVYLNGEFYGIFSWQLKKHRDNYHMNKSSAEHVHLDGTLDTTTMFNGKDNIDWSQFEIRNPKGLYAIGGNKYDADIKQEEIAGEAEVNIWIAAGQLPDGTNITDKIKKNLQITARVKSYIQNLSDSAILLEEAMISYENSNKTSEDFKTLQEVYEQHFCIDNFVDYLIMINIIDDGDSLAKNWQWITYDGIHWFVNLYDCDVSFGAEPYGRYISSPYNGNLGEWSPSPSKCIIKYFSNVIDKRYKYLSDMQIINADNIFSILKKWTERIGTDYYIAEFKKWNNSPCISDSIVRSEYWEILFDENKVPQTDKEETFDAKKAYNIGDVVSFGIKQDTGYYKFKCIAPTQALANNTPHSISTYSPIREFRHCDSLYRVEKWIISKINILDKLHNYNR